MRILGITHARGGSKSVPGKNIRKIHGKPLLAYTIEEALKSEYISEYVVSSDSKLILDVAKEYGAFPIQRPKHLAQDDTPSIDGLIHALDNMEELMGFEYQVTADLRATNPMKTVADIDGAIKKLMTTGADTVVGVSEAEPPQRIKFVVSDHLVDVWPETSGNRQDLSPQCYVRNGSMYIVRTSALREGIHFSGGDIRPWYMPRSKSINIDTELDFLLAEKLLEGRDDRVGS